MRPMNLKYVARRRATRQIASVCLSVTLASATIAACATGDRNSNNASDAGIVRPSSGIASSGLVAGSGDMGATGATATSGAALSGTSSGVIDTSGSVSGSFGTGSTPGSAVAGSTSGSAAAGSTSGSAAAGSTSGAAATGSTSGSAAAGATSGSAVSGASSGTLVAATAAPGSQTVTAGSTAAWTVTVTASSGFGDTVNLTVAGLPAGAMATFNPASIAGGSGTSTLSVPTSPSTPPGSYPLTITATDATNGSLRSAQVTLTIDPNCAVATANSGWQDAPFAIQTATFTAEYDATPSASPNNGVVALSNGTQTDYAGFAALVRFNPEGDIDARDGGAYDAASVIPYAARQKYHFRVVVNVASHTYSSFVTPPGGAELTIGRNFAFRTEHAHVPGLNHWGVDVDPNGAGTTTVCNFGIQ